MGVRGKGSVVDPFPRPFSQLSRLLMRSCKQDGEGFGEGPVVGPSPIFPVIGSIS